MSAVPFCRAVTYGPHPKTCLKNMLEKVDDYFFLKGRKVQFIPGFRRGKSEGVIETADHKDSALQTALKIASYCTVIIPLIALLAKVVLRCIYKFHFIPAADAPNLPQPYSSQPPIPPIKPYIPPPDNNNRGRSYPYLEFDKPRKLSVSEVIKLEIRETLALLEDGTAVRHKGFSTIEEYKDSWFAHYVIDSDTYVVVRRHLTDDPIINIDLLPFDKPTELSWDKVSKLKLNADENGNAFSGLSWYQNSFFNYKVVDGKYFITRKRLEDFKLPPRIPMDKEILINNEEFLQLKINPESMKFSDDGYVHGTSDTARFKWKEAMNNNLVIIRC